MLNTIFIIGAFQSFFFAFILLAKKQNPLPNRFMGLWLLVLCLSFVEYWITNTGFYLQYPYLAGIISGAPLVYGPFFFLYVYYLLNPQRKWDWKQWWHFLPVILYYLTGLASFFSVGAEEKIAIMEQIRQGEPPMVIFVWGIIKGIHGFLYMAYVVRYLGNFEQQAFNRFSNPDHLRIKWLKILAYCLLAIYGLAILNNALVLFWGINVEFILGLCAAILILGGSYFAIKQQTLFKTEEWKVRASDSSEIGLPTQELKLRVSEYMDQEKPYLNPDFNMQQFAAGIEIPTKQLSAILNQGFGVNFFTFVNQYRVEEVISRMKDPKNDHLTLLGIAYDCGFNSKTTFNTVFRKLTGQTPSKFKKSLDH